MRNPFKFRKELQEDALLFLILITSSFFFLSLVNQHFEGLGDRLRAFQYDFFTRNPLTQQPRERDSVVIFFTDEDLVDEGEPRSLLQDFLKKVRKTDFKQLYLVLPPQVFDYEDLLFQDIFSQFSVKEKVFVGLSPRRHEQRDFKAYLEHPQIGVALSPRKYRREVVRSYPIFSSSKNEGLVEYGISQWQKKNLGVDSWKYWKAHINEQRARIFSRDHSLLLDYSLLEEIPKFPLKKLESLKEKGLLENKFVYFGYGGLKKKSVAYFEGTFMNTPWNGDEGKEEEGVPLLFLYPLIGESLKSTEFLRKENLSSHAFFFGVLFCLSFFSWFFQRRMMSLTFFCALSLLIFFTSWYLFSFEGIFCDGFSLMTALFLGGFYGSFFSEKRYIEKKRKEKGEMEEINMNSSRDNQIFLRVLKGVDSFVRESKESLEQIVLEKQNHFDKEVKSLLEQKSSLVFSNIKGLYHYVLALEKSGVFKEKVSVKAALEELLVSFESQIAEKKITLILSFPEDLCVFTDPILFKAILYNIVSNAIKYTFDGTKIRIEAKNTSKFFTLSVADQGPGFNLSKGDERRSEYALARKGYGLGLYLSQVIAEKIDIKFKLRKTEEYASIFDITIKKD